eukprot:SAG31_NODE_11229_length_1051_cov_1.790966_2_plen_86_part_01
MCKRSRILFLVHANCAGFADTERQTVWSGVLPSTRFWEGLPAVPDAIDPEAVVLHSPFPARLFDGTGLETFRFNWAIADRLLRLRD